MKGRIDRGGSLILERGGKLRSHVCPFTISSLNEGSPCGDWCPHFHEPAKIMEDRVMLEICNGTRWVFDKKDFTDEREVTR